MTHVLKILKQYADEVAAGNKPFEVRKNDRNFQKGDRIQFLVIDMQGLHALDKTMYEITYVLSDFPTGLQDGYVVLGIRQIRDITD